MLQSLVNYIWAFFNADKTVEVKEPKPKPPKRPKYRLVPNTLGTYDLEKWNKGIHRYCYTCMVRNSEAGDKMIARLEQDIIYYREGESK